MSFPPTPVANGQVIDAPYYNSAFAAANTLIGNAQTTANAAVASIAAASSVPVAGALVKYDPTTKMITLQPGTLSRNVMREMGVWASNPPSTVVNYGGGSYIDKNALVPTPRYLPAGTTSHAAPVDVAGVHQERWDIVSFNTGTAGVTVKTGTSAAIGTSNIGGVPTLPSALTITASGDAGLYAVYTKYGMTSITDVYDGTNGFIVPLAALNFGGGSGGGGGGGSGLLNTDFAWVWGGAADDPVNAQDPFTMLLGTAGTGIANGHKKEDLRTGLIRIGTDSPESVANAPSGANLFGHSLGGAEFRVQDYIQISGNQVTLQPSATPPYPLTAMFPDGHMAQLKTAISHSVSPSPGDSIYAIVLDKTPGLVTTGGPGVPNPWDGTMDFQLITPPPSSTSATQLVFGYLINNGTNFLPLGYGAFDSHLQVSSTQVSPLTENANSVPTGGTGAYSTSATLGGMTVITQGTKVTHFPRNMKVKSRGVIRITAAAGVHLYGGLFIDGMLLGNFWDNGLNTTAVWDLPGYLGGSYGSSSDGLSMVAGLHTMTVQVFGYATSVAFTVLSLNWDLEAWGVFP